MTAIDVSDGVKRLATVVSIAARIEPELLRAMRLRLLRDVDVSAEGDLWFSELVASRSARRIVLDADVATELRTELKKDQELLHGARAVLVEMHAAAPPAVQLEEEITYLALTGTDVADAINTKLMAVLNAIATEGRTGLIDWAARALPRMPEAARRTPAAGALRIVSEGSTGDAVFVTPGIASDPQLAGLIQRALPKAPATTAFVRLVPDESGVALELSREEAAGAEAISLPKTEPLVVELFAGDAAEVIEIPREGVVTRPMTIAVTIRTISGEEYTIRERTEEATKPLEMLVLTRLGIHEIPQSNATPDVVLIAGDVAETASEAEYYRAKEWLLGRFGSIPIIAVPGPHDVQAMLEGVPMLDAFERFRNSLGPRGTAKYVGNDFARTLVIGEWHIGVVGLHTAYGDDPWKGSFDTMRLASVCDGDPAGWCNAHDLAILLMHHAPEHFGDESHERWEVYGAPRIFDLVLCGSMDTLTEQIENDALVIGTPPVEKGYLQVTVERQPNVVILSAVRRLRDGTGGGPGFPLRPRQRIPFPTPDDTRLRVLVTGLRVELRVEEQEISRAIGTLLALQGHELATSGESGVELVVTEVFEDIAPDRVHRIPDLGETDVVITIYPASWDTLEVYREALNQKKPLIPIGRNREHREQARAKWPPDAHPLLDRLHVQSNVAEVVGVVDQLLRLVPRDQRARAPKRKKIFLSYSTADASFYEELRTLLAPAIEAGVVDVWNETRVPKGRGGELVAAVDAAAAAILLVSPSFLESSWIQAQLPLLAKAADEGLAIVWLQVRPSPWRQSELVRFQTASPSPLAELEPAARRQVLERVVSDVFRRHIDFDLLDVESLEAVAALLAKTDAPRERAVAMSRLGIAYRDAGRLDEARGAQNEALRGFVKVGMGVEAARVRHELGRTLRLMGEHDLAIESYEGALRPLMEAGSNRHVAEVARELGDTYRTVRKFDRAIEPYELAHRLLADEHAVTESAHVLAELADAFHMAGRIGDAISSYEAALRIFIEQHLIVEAARVQRSLGNIYATRSEKERAIEHYEGALVDGLDDHERAEIQLALGDLHAQRRDSATAYKLYVEAAQTYARLGRTKDCIEVLRRLDELKPAPPESPA